MKFMIVIPIYVVFLSIRETKSASVSQRKYSLSKMQAELNYD